MHDVDNVHCLFDGLRRPDLKDLAAEPRASDANDVWDELQDDVKLEQYWAGTRRKISNRKLVETTYTKVLTAS